MTKNFKRSLKFWAIIKKNGVSVTGLERIVCRVLLPAKATGSISVTFYPTRDQADLLKNLWEFSFSGELKLANGEAAEVIECRRALLKRIAKTRWDLDLVDIEAPVSVEDLTITHYLSQEAIDKRDHVQARFWLSPNRMLSDASIVEQHYTRAQESRLKREKKKKDPAGKHVIRDLGIQ